MTRTFPTPNDIVPVKPLQDIINAIETKIKSNELTFVAPYGWNKYYNQVKSFLENHKWSLTNIENQWIIQPMV